MFGLGWLSLLEQKLSPLSIDPKRCARVRSDNSSCHACQEVCPTQGISISDGEIHITDCLVCSLCTAVCPTEALTWKHPSLREVIDLAKEAVQEEEGFALACSRSPVLPHSFPVIRLPCLALLSWEIWVGLMKSFPSLSIYLPQGVCAKCPTPAGERIWKERMNRAEEIMGREVPILLSPPIKERNKKEEKKALDLGRRQFLTSFFHEIKETPKEALKEWMKSPNLLPMIKEETGLNQSLFSKYDQPYGERRAFLLQILHEDEEVAQKISIKLPTIRETCEPCGACSLLCPTQALEQVETEEETLIYLTPSRCLACNLCEEVCWDRCISLKDASGTRLLGGREILHAYSHR